MNTYNDSPVKTFNAGAAVADRRLVKLSAAGTVVHAGAGEDSIGVSVAAAASGAGVPVKMWNSNGTFLVEAAGTFAAGAALYPAADGKIDDVVAGQKCATANEACTAGAQLIEVLPSTAASNLAASVLADPVAVTQDALTLTSMTGTANTAPAAETNIDALTGTLTGTLDNSLADVSGSWDATAIATINKNFKELQAELNTQRALNIVMINNCKTYATQLNKAGVDIGRLHASQVSDLAILEANGMRTKT